MTPDPLREQTGLSEQRVAGPLPEAERVRGWIELLGSLFLLLAPFAFFAALVALDGLLR